MLAIQQRCRPCTVSVCNAAAVPGRAGLAHMQWPGVSSRREGEPCAAWSKAGAGRIELCAGLIEGGTTPSVGLLQVVKQCVRVPVFVMIRPRGGDFLYSDREVDVMKADARLAKLHGADGLVFGALTEDGRIDTELCMALLGARAPGPVSMLYLPSCPTPASEPSCPPKYSRENISSGRRQTVGEPCVAKQWGPQPPSDPGEERGSQCLLWELQPVWEAGLCLELWGQAAAGALHEVQWEEGRSLGLPAYRHWAVCWGQSVVWGTQWICFCRNPLVLGAASAECCCPNPTAQAEKLPVLAESFGASGESGFSFPKQC
ncbi:copper homeostasis protein cutC homolog isoform X2 [Alligator sinensis]|uniref:Copper homeostasis protein cutC homolog n=1 Tax=Alligator sinensis TaxID=38654 RepID=A0A3Q0HLH8_ALLSI|nr:copper homeostasis protein cutC homolog isoform X2 [Alligator sinensis]